MERKRFFTSRNVAFLAVLVALVVVLQVLSTLVGRLGGTPLSLVLIPVVLGAVMIGPLAGALLGFIFGIVTAVCGVTGFDGWTFLLFSEQPVLTVLLCLVKGTAAGAAAGLLYKLIARKNRYAGVIVAALAAPVVNTGIFVAGAFLMSGAIQNVMAATGVDSGTTLVYYVIIGLAGVNFLIEFAINAVASPAIYRIAELFMRRRRPAPAAGAEQAQDTEVCSGCGADVAVKGGISECPNCGAPVQLRAENVSPAAKPAHGRADK